MSLNGNTVSSSATIAVQMTLNVTLQVGGKQFYLGNGDFQ